MALLLHSAVFFRPFRDNVTDMIVDAEIRYAADFVPARARTTRRGYATETLSSWKILIPPIRVIAGIPEDDFMDRP
jgi:hypothetical protein